jgi:hypothetical protein
VIWIKTFYGMNMIKKHMLRSVDWCTVMIKNPQTSSCSPSSMRSS